MKFKLSYTAVNPSRVIEINTLEELIELTNKEGFAIIIQENYQHSKDESLPKYEIEVYNDYRE